MKILNLYAGIGGNRKLWGDEHEITAVEMNPDIAAIYQEFFPNDKMVVGDAHQYLLDHFQEFDVIWASPPCQSHTRMIRSGKNRKPRFPDMKLYEEIIFLKYNFDGIWLVENVKPYYEPLFNPIEISRHLFWSNKTIKPFEHQNIKGFINKCNVAGAEELKIWLGLNYKGNIYYNGNHDPSQVLRNCVHPEVGKNLLAQIIKSMNEKQLEFAL